MMRRAPALLLILLTTACAARAPAAGSNPARWEGDAQLYRHLTAFPLGRAENDSIAAYVAAHPDDAHEQLAIAAEDQNAPSAVRANALFTLARLQSARYLHVFRTALDDPDVRVRATAVAAMREFVDVRRNDALQIARAGLDDRADEVQAQALQILSEGELDVLRRYLARQPAPELAAIARSLIAVAEERGAALVADPATGVLRRTSVHGHTVEFSPVQHWPQWEAATGRVTVRPAGGGAIPLDGMEVVGGVIPLFFSPDGDVFVYEQNRRIVVRSIADGAERDLGAGIAPRPAPFTEDFVFLRELPDSRMEQRERTIIRYQALHAPFRAERAPQLLTTITAAMTFGVRGGYSPVRWAQVEERGGTFYLIAENMEAVPLPGPFSGAEQ